MISTSSSFSKSKSPDIHIKKNKPKKSTVYDTYWRFAAERQSIFFKRTKGQILPWTNDAILKQFKFTNAYRASDRVSQFLIREVIYKGNQAPNEVLFRILLFKLFNKIETWNALTTKLNEVSYRTYKFETYDKVLTKLKDDGKAIYSGAYIMASGRSYFGYPLKHQNHLLLIQKIIKSELPDRIQSLNTLEQLYVELKEFPTIGPFLAYQYAIDINYSSLTHFQEMEFVKAGPGAKDGIKKCFTDLGDYTEEDAIRMMADQQEKEFDRLGIEFQTLWGRRLQLIDCQNLFCEVDKYARVAHPEVSSISNRVRIKQKFQPTSLKPIEYFFPPKWKIAIS
jgi:hypothetical protein